MKNPNPSPRLGATATALPGKSQVYVYSPSGAVRDKAAFKRGIRRLQALGCTVEVDPAALESCQRFAGTDSARLQAIHRAAASGADVALTSRGGYGLSRLLPHIDYPLLARAVANGCSFVGYSDFTALQTALFAQTGAMTWAGPVLGSDFGGLPEADETMLACFEDVLLKRAEGTGWRIPKSKTTGPAADFTIENAVLWGGNLTMLVSLLGTPYMPSVEAVKGGILFLEDTGEAPYKIERMLAQLLHAGYLEVQQAILFGEFDGYTRFAHDRGFALPSVLQWLAGRTPARLVSGLPFGHGPLKVLLPVGCKNTTLVVEGRQALLLWGDVF